MPITILDYVKDQIGEKTTYTAEDFSRAGVDIIGGCEVCGATLAGYNAYPAKSGYWRCADCITEDGFATVEQFINFVMVEEFISHGTGPTMPPAAQAADDTGAGLVNCPACGGVQNITEIWEQVFKCGDCGSTWRP
jgi:hypothetical protein